LRQRLGSLIPTVRSKRAEILRQQQERRLYGATELPRLELPALLQSQTTDLGKMIFGSTGRLVDKWTHYPRAYEPHFSRFRETDVRMLEIGVYLGGSLDVWRQYFGPAATIFGIDIDPRCGERVTPPNQVRIGSQADPDFLAAVVSEMGRPDIILDDGSHLGTHQRTSFEVLFPLLADNGIYAIEDLHTSYWAEWSGGVKRPGTGIELVKELIDQMHGWYQIDTPATLAQHWIPAIHIYDSIVLIEKRARTEPRHVQVGSG
jgi:hypothetical protein